MPSCETDTDTSLWSTVLFRLKVSVPSTFLEVEDISIIDYDNQSDKETVIFILENEGPKPVKELQERLKYKSRNRFLKEVINPLMQSKDIYRDGKPKSPTSLIKLTR